MKVKVSEASDHVLDYLVATADGWTFGEWHKVDGTWQIWAEKLDDKGNGPAGYFPGDDRLRFSTNPAAAWPIIDREEIHTYTQYPRVPSVARVWYAQIKGGKYRGFGPTGLIAAMRCFVVSRLGDEVEVPEELLS